MKNFEFEWDNKKYWYSRSMAVLVIVVGELGRERHILATQRGINTPDYQGYWCMPCGYLDFGETLKDAARRELFEETGIKIPHVDFKLIGIDDEPENDARQNVTIRYMCNVGDICNLEIDYLRNDEVSNVKWIFIDDISKYKWAFDHLVLINKYVIGEKT